MLTYLNWVTSSVLYGPSQSYGYEYKFIKLIAVAIQTIKLHNSSDQIELQGYTYIRVSLNEPSNYKYGQTKCDYTVSDAHIIFDPLVW